MDRQRIRFLAGLGKGNCFQVIPLCGRDTQFLLQFSNQGLLVLLAWFHMTAEYVPDPGIKCPRGRALTQKDSLRSNDQCCNNLMHNVYSQVFFTNGRLLSQFDAAGGNIKCPAGGGSIQAAGSVGYHKVAFWIGVPCPNGITSNYQVIDDQ